MMIPISTTTWVAVEKIESVSLRNTGGSRVVVGGIDYYTNRSPKTIIEEINAIPLPPIVRTTV